MVEPLDKKIANVHMCVHKLANPKCTLYRHQIDVMLYMQAHAI
jgi:hypothetical protein